MRGGGDRNGVGRCSTATPSPSGSARDAGRTLDGRAWDEFPVAQAVAHA